MKTYEICSGWGRSIQFRDWEKRRIVGWMPEIPAIGDRLRAQLQSGRFALFTFVKVERQRDPTDMFFATVEDIGYEDELPAEVG